MTTERKKYELGDRASFKVMPILKEYLAEINEIPNGEFSALCNVALYEHFLFNKLDAKIGHQIEKMIDEKLKEFEAKLLIRLIKE